VAVYDQKEGTERCEPSAAAAPLEKPPASIVAKGGDYLLPIKGNQPHLLQQAHGLDALQDHPFFIQTHSGHGRVEVRHLHACPGEPLAADFPHTRTVIVVRSQRTVQKTGATTAEARYYLSSARPGGLIARTNGCNSSSGATGAASKSATTGGGMRSWARRTAHARASPTCWPIWRSSRAPCSTSSPIIFQTDRCQKSSQHLHSRPSLCFTLISKS
jgi:hypothetical protein